MSWVATVTSAHPESRLPTRPGDSPCLEGAGSAPKAGRITGGASLSLAVLFAAAALAGAADRTPPPAFVPNEIIVKFRKTAADAVERQLELKTSAAEPTLPQEAGLPNARYKVSRIKPVVANFRANHRRVEGLRAKTKDLLTRKEKRILNRLQRAPRGAAVPDLDRIYKMEVALEPGQSLEEVLRALRSSSSVEYAELNYIVSICRTPDDILCPMQWSLNNRGQYYPASGQYGSPPGKPDRDIDAPEAWDKSTGISDIVVAVVDTGVDYAHRDLDDNMWVNEKELTGTEGVDDDGNGYVDDVYGYDFGDEDADPNDDHGHGTHCAGIIAAEGNNGLDIAGVCWRTRIMAVKFLRNDGQATVGDAVEALYYAIENGADVTSNSWGGLIDANALREAFDYAYSQGVMAVAAAGNDDSDNPIYPGGYDKVFSVAATDSDDERAAFSNYGLWVDIAAPGVDILSLRASGTFVGSVYDDFTTVASGTSMACPHVAGACAMLLSIDDGISIDELRDAMMVTTDPIAPGICASGRLNLYGAVLRILGPKGNVWLNNDVYSCSDLIDIKLFDTDLSASGTQQVTVSTDEGDSETVVLTEIEDVPGIFVGSIATASGIAGPEDGLLQVADGRLIFTQYHDANDGTGNAAIATDTATADCRMPLVLGINLDVPGPQPRITFQTDEPTTARVLYSQTCGDPGAMSATDAILTTSHTVKLPVVLPETDYFFAVVARDAVGNETVDDNAGRCYAFTTDRPGPLYVPSQYHTIQDAIDHSWNSGTVWVADGVYRGPGNREIDFKGKAITVRSENGPENCIVDCEGTETDRHRGFQLYNGEKLDSVLDGFTITNGYARYGGAIYCGGVSPVIRNCIIRGNVAVYNGGGVYGGMGIIANCVISGNVAADNGGGVADFDGLITSCTIVGNAAQYGSGLYGCEGMVSNCIVWDNRPADSLRYSSSVPVYSCVEAGSDGTGCIDSDPCFLQPGHWDQNDTPDDANDDYWVEGDYHLRPFSPCIDTGIYAYCMSLPCPDLDGNLRLAGVQIDMGCYEADGPPDRDGDWLSDSAEPGYEAEPDRDGDGIPDGLELLRGSDPNLFDPLGQWNVPEGVNTVQKALFFSRPGETIVLGKGTYYENVCIGGRDIVLTGTRPDDWEVTEATIVSGDTDANSGTANGRVVTFIGIESSKCEIRGLTITGGHVPRTEGGGIWGGGTRARMTNCVVTGNAGYGYGGGVQWFFGTISNCLISANKGGGLYGCHGLVTNCSITDNTDAVLGGGLGWCYGVISNCKITGNIAMGGGGLWLPGVVSNCVINANMADASGGGVLMGGGPITGCVITGNWAGQNGGALADCLAQITNCTISGNYAGRRGGGVYNLSQVRGEPTKLANCIVWDNTSPSGPQIALEVSPFLPAPGLAVSYTDVQGGQAQISVDPSAELFWLPGNLDEQPDFASAGCWTDVNDPNVAVEPNDPNAVWIDGDYHLLGGSPCIDAGDPNYPFDSNETDIDGQIRVFDGRVDMGADEFVPPIEVPLRFTPPLLNVRSKGRWLKAHLMLPASVGIGDVDTRIPLRLEPLAIESDYVNAFVKRDGVVEIVAAFDRGAFCQVAYVGATTVTVEGLLNTGQVFYGTGTIDIISNGLRYLAALASHWLEAGCSSPDWCGGADLDQDSTVNFADFAMFDTCGIKVVAQ